MDTSLFQRHIKILSKNVEEKILLISHIKEVTGIELHEREIVIDKMKVSFSVSSTVHSVLIKKNIKTILRDKGYHTN